LVEGRILDVPPSAGDLEGRGQRDPSGPLAHDGHTPGLRRRAGLGRRDDGAHDADLALVGIQRLKFIDVPECDLLPGFGIMAVLT
jgi:hypothetical protein